MQSSLTRVCLPRSCARPETNLWGELPPRLAPSPASMAAEAAASTPALKMASPPLGEADPTRKGAPAESLRLSLPAVLMTPTILPPRDLSDTHFPPCRPPLPHPATQRDMLLLNKSHTRPAAATANAAHPNGPATAWPLPGAEGPVGLAD
ncbi:MAG: hypothetical protein FRX49_11416 [Trebouxia sp. A1-2]|nr:MAG: hypothetical protein FRX49_11416 [Trebouxia sp. A1-2]